MINDGQRITRIATLTLSLMIIATAFSVVFSNTRKLGDVVGYVYDVNGQYLRYGNNAFALYYPILSCLCLAVFELVQTISIRLRCFLNVSENGEWILRIYTAAMIGIIEIIVAAYFLVASCLIVRQVTMPNFVLPICLSLIISLMIGMLMITIVCSIKYKEGLYDE